jgi:hypothetical protein
MSKSHSHSHPRPPGYEQLAAAVSNLKVTAPLAEPAHTSHGATATSVRRAQHHGHTVEVITTYQFKIDGQPVLGHFSVDNAGKVHCHDLPNYVFSSALELGKRLVDLMPTGEPIVDELNDEQPGPPPHGGHGEHPQGGHSHGGH